MTIIPQDPSLLSGTVKENIDPSGVYDEKEILRLMRKAGLTRLLSREDGINMEVDEGGANLSVGERQLICIIRAIMRRAKLVIMDEATANIDV